MVHEIDFKYVKKGIMVAVCNIPISDSYLLDCIDMTPKTCPKISLIARLNTGNSLTVAIWGRHTFPVAGTKEVKIYHNIFTEEVNILEILAGYFKIYVLDWVTDATTTAELYLFFEYDYDLIK